jgi:hypothetical protein
MVKYLNIFLIIFAITSVANAADFTASISQNEVSAGDNLTLTLKLSYTSAKGEPDTSALGKSFNILGQQQSSSTVIDNGHYSASKSWGYVISPKKDGSLTIPAMSIDTDAGILTTEPITVEVGKAAQLPRHDSDSNVVISASVNKQNPYKNEPIIYTVQLISKSSLSSVSLGQVTVPNAIVEPQGEPKIMDKVQNGISVKVIQEQYLVTPLKEGEMILPPVMMRGNVASAKKSALNNQFMMMQGFGGFDPFGAFNSFEPFAIATNEVKLEVKKPDVAMDPFLPASSVTISENFDSANAKVGEPLTRKITIIAHGEVGSQLPSLEAQQANASDFKVYADKPVIKDEITVDKITGKREETYTLIPQKSGEITLPEISLAWWDIKNNQAAYAKLPARIIKIAPGIIDKNQPPAPENNTPQIQQKPNAEPAQETQKQSLSQSDIILYSVIAALFLVLLFVFIIVVKLQKKLARLKNDDSAIPTKQKIKEPKKQPLSHKDIGALATSDEIKIFLQAYASEHWGAPKNASLETIFTMRPDIKKEYSDPFIKDLNAALYAGKKSDIEKLKQQLDAIINSTSAKVKKQKKSGEKLPVLNPS